MPDKNGVTERTKFSQVKAKGFKVPELDEVDISSLLHWEPYFTSLEDVFYELNCGRQYGDDGPQMMSWTDLEAGLRLLKYNLDEYEVQFIKVLDLTWVQTVKSTLRSLAEDASG